MNEHIVDGGGVDLSSPKFVEKMFLDMHTGTWKWRVDLTLSRETVPSRVYRFIDRPVLALVCHQSLKGRDFIIGLDGVWMLGNLISQRSIDQGHLVLAAVDAHDRKFESPTFVRSMTIRQAMKFLNTCTPRPGKPGLSDYVYVDRNFNEIPL